MDVDIGKKLKKIRNAHGLSQRQLANRSGVTNGTISMIEKNRTSPSVGSLKKVLEGFPMSLSEFFSADAEEEEEAYFFTNDELKELNPGMLTKIGATGEVDVSLKQVGDASRHSLQMLFETYPPGSDTGEDMLSHESEEAGVNQHLKLTRYRHLKVTHL